MNFSLHGRFQQAKQPLQWIISNSKKYKNLHYEAGRALVCVYKKLSQYDAALQVIEYLKEFFSGDTTRQSLLFFEHALVRIHLGESEKWSKEAPAGDDIFGPSTSQFIDKQYFLMMQARCMELTGRVTDAIKCYENIRATCEEHRMRFAQIQVETNIGYCLMSIGENHLADKFLRTALAKACNGDHQYWIAEACLGIMDLAFKRDDILEAKEFGRHCFTLTLNNGYRKLFEDACICAGDYYESHNNTEVADAFYRKAVSVGSERPAQVLKKVDLIYNTSYSRQTFNLRFNSINHKQGLDKSIGPLKNTNPLPLIKKHRFIFGSIRSTAKKVPDRNGSKGKGREE